MIMGKVFYAARGSVECGRKWGSGGKGSFGK